MQPSQLPDAQPLVVFMHGRGMVKVGRFSRVRGIWQWRGQVKQLQVPSEDNAVQFGKPVWLKLLEVHVQQLELVDTSDVGGLWVCPMDRASNEGRRANHPAGARFLVPELSWDRYGRHEVVHQLGLFEGQAEREGPSSALLL